MRGPTKPPGDAAGITAKVARTDAADARRVVAPVSFVLYGILIAGIGLAGWYGWTRLVLPLAPLIDPASPLALSVFGGLVGTAALFSPCAFPLFPAYITWYLALDDRAGATSRRWRSLGYGAVCGLGAIVFFLLIGVGLSALGGALSSYLIGAKPVVALILVGVGVVLLTDRALPVPAWASGGKFLTAPAAERQPLYSLFLYGFGYGLASTGCTLPIYVGLVVFPLSSGAFTRAFTAFLSFALAMGGLMTLLTVLIAGSKQTLLRHLLASTVRIRRASGVILILIGLYLGYYFLKAGM
jgi:cytochrome c-type biogenesis protein